MVTKVLTKALDFFSCLILRQLRYNVRCLHRKVSNVNASQFKYKRCRSFVNGSNLSQQALIFSVEGALLKSSSLFPYFMHVAFEAGSLIRAFILLVLYPFICLFSEEVRLKIMVLVSFIGIRKANFRVGRAVLPKFFLKNVGLEGFEMASRAKKKVAVTDMPQVMVESFLKEYLNIDVVVGRELKVVCGFFVGVMEDKNQDVSIWKTALGEDADDAETDMDAYGFSSFNQYLGHQHLFSQCKEIYFTSEAERRSWHILPRDKYPQPLVFHDGRLAFRPTPTASLSMFMWLPFGFFLAIFRAIVALLLPFSMSIPILGCTGLVVKVQLPPKSTTSSASAKSKGLLYVCNHRTLLDPLYLSFTLKKEPTAVTYSLSRMSELLSPIRTVRLTRDRHEDSKMMERMLSQGDLVVCPEGTTCREPYLLRFSPLFAELSDEIVPVAMDTHVSMFYGTTASGLKCLDPLFFLMNPCPSYNIVLLDKVSGLSRCRDQDHGGESIIDVANQIQSELGKTLGFQCTNLTRKHKYLILAGNEGYVARRDK